MHSVRKNVVKKAKKLSTRIIPTRRDYSSAYVGDESPYAKLILHNKRFPD
jgi:hypothetical protein